MKRTAWLTLALALSLAPSSILAAVVQTKRPNVVLIITDDQGHGDLGFHGNPKIRTPNLDQLARESVRLENFYVMPVCSPTRACLMTGRYNYRTGVVDTYLGRSLMHPDEVTLAEMLSDAGYRTGIFGKWHLGDNYPMRAIDQGFQEALVMKGGGIGQPSDPPGGESYFDPILQRNGQPVKMTGYVSDVITDAALDFIGQNRDRPFFAYLAFNAPHTPLQAPEKSYTTYKSMNLAHEAFPKAGHPLPGQADAEMIAKVYAMVENIDDNVGRLLAKLDEWKLAQDTIVIFLTDNGPQQVRYNSGMFERKGTVHEGGIRVPCFVRWAGRMDAGRAVKQIAAHIDLAPTLLDLCGAKKPATVKFDGVSLAPLLRGEGERWPGRTLYFQWHRGDAPQMYRAFAARSQRYKLVQPDGAQEIPWTNAPVFKLYDMATDPLEFRDIAGEQPEIVERMRRGYERWFKDVTARRDYASPSRIHLGARQENPVLLTRQDWRGPRAGWKTDSLGHWEVQVVQRGVFSISAHFRALQKPATIRFSLDDTHLERQLRPGEKECRFEAVPLKAGKGRLQISASDGNETIGPQFLEIRRLP